MKYDMDIFSGTASFSVSIDASSNKQTYNGLFKVKCILSPLEYINSDSLYRELLGKTNPQMASEYVSNLCYALSQLKYRMIESPTWFKTDSVSLDGSDIDDKILMHILDLAVGAENEYRTKIEEKYSVAKEEVKKAVENDDFNDIDDD